MLYLKAIVGGNKKRQLFLMFLAWSRTRYRMISHNQEDNHRPSLLVSMELKQPRRQPQEKRHLKNDFPVF